MSYSTGSNIYCFEINPNLFIGIIGIGLAFDCSPLAEIHTDHVWVAVPAVVLRPHPDASLLPLPRSLPGPAAALPRPAPAPPPQPRPPAPAPSVKVETGVKTEAAAGSTTTIKKEAVITKPQPPGPTPAAPTPEEGEIVEKSVLGILRGRNPVTFGGFSRISPLNNRI